MHTDYFIIFYIKKSENIEKTANFLEKFRSDSNQNNSAAIESNTNAINVFHSFSIHYVGHIGYVIQILKAKPKTLHQLPNTRQLPLSLNSKIRCNLKRRRTRSEVQGRSLRKITRDVTLAVYAIGFSPLLYDIRIDIYRYNIIRFIVVVVGGLQYRDRIFCRLEHVKARPD